MGLGYSPKRLLVLSFIKYGSAIQSGSQKPATIAGFVVLGAESLRELELFLVRFISCILVLSRC